MPNTHGFQIVVQVSVNFLRHVLTASWKSGLIPQSLDIPAGTTFGNFIVKDGQIQIPQNQLDIFLEPNVGVKIKIGVVGQAHLQDAQNKGVPSLSLQDIKADVFVHAPIGLLVGPDQGQNDIGIQLTPPPQTTVKLTGADSAARIDELVTEQIRSLAADAPSFKSVNPVKVIYHLIEAYTVSELLETVSDSSHQINVVKLPPLAPRVEPRLRITLPVKFHWFNINQQPGLDPPPPLLQGFVVEARLIVTALLVADPVSPGGFQVQLNAPTTSLSVEAIIPQSAASAHYAGNQARLGPEFDSIVADHIVRSGFEFLKQMGDLAISIPTVDSIQNALATFIQTQMSAKKFISIWPPKASEGLPLTIEGPPIVKVLPEGLAIAINKGTGGADADALSNLIPPSRDLAFVISAEGMSNIFEIIKLQHKPFHRYEEDDHKFDLKSLSLSLRTGALHFDGEMTVIDAIPPCFDVDASFGADVHLSWNNNKSIEAKSDNPTVDAHLSVLAWLISLILGFLTAGGVGVIIAIILDKVCEAVATNVGTNIVKDPNFTSVTAWPINLPKIGEVKANFDNPIDISPDGLLFSATVAP